MSELFQQHIAKFAEIDQKEFSDILKFFKIVNVKKKENLLTEGQVCKYNYFVLHGCLRKFFINDKGIEQTTEFAIENWWITDNISYEHRVPSTFYIQAVEHSTLINHR